MKDGHEYKLCIKEKIITDNSFRELVSVDLYDSGEEVVRKINHRIENIVDSYPNTSIHNDYINRHGRQIKRVKLTWFSNNQRHESLFWMDFIDCTTKNKFSQV